MHAFAKARLWQSSITAAKTAAIYRCICLETCMGNEWYSPGAGVATEYNDGRSRWRRFDPDQSMRLYQNIESSAAPSAKAAPTATKNAVTSVARFFSSAMRVVSCL